MERHAADVHRFLLSLGASPDDAEDALQDCFVSAWRSAEAFRGSGSARSWLLTIARNALHRHRRRRAGEPAGHEPLAILGERAGWGAETQFDRRFEARDELERALEQLVEEEREVLVLRDLEGYSGQETAQVLGISLAAMKSRLHRARLHLMADLREREDEDA